jgi:hypothetical protein
MQKFFQPEVLDGNNKYKCDGWVCLCLFWILISFLFNF